MPKRYPEAKVWGESAWLGAADVIALE
jgi:hypothetical protein